MQLFGAAACFLFASGTPLQASKLTFGSNSDACYAAFLRSLTETLRGLNSCICALTSSFLKTAVLHHFPSGGRVGVGVQKKGCARWGAALLKVLFTALPLSCGWL